MICKLISYDWYDFGIQDHRYTCTAVIPYIFTHVYSCKILYTFILAVELKHCKDSDPKLTKLHLKYFTFYLLMCTAYDGWLAEKCSCLYL